MKMNINEEIFFAPTPKGEEVLDREGYSYLLRNKYLGIYCRMQLWTFMNLFGPFFYNGCRDQVLHENEIHFSPPLS